MNENLNILIIEDDDNHAELLLRAIKQIKADIKVTVIKTISEAYIELKNSKPSILIVDWKLPDGYGTDLLKNPITHNFPSIILTSHGNEALAVESIKSGAIDYITKSPEVYKDIYRIILRVLREWEHIVKRKEAEEELIRNEEKFRSIVENINDIVWITDLNLKPLYVTPSIEKLTGYSIEEFLSMSVEDMYENNSANDIKNLILSHINIFKDVTNKDIILGGEFQYKRKNKRAIWVQVSLKPIYNKYDELISFLGTSVNIDARKHSETALKKSETLYRDLVENLNDAIFQLNQDGRILFVSSAISMILGYETQDMIGSIIYKFILKDDLGIIQQAFANTFAGKNEIAEFRMLRKDGDYSWVSASNRLLYKREELIIIQGILTDITEKKKIFDELIDAKLKAEEANKLKSEFIANISHELRTPLNSILGFCQLSKQIDVTIKELTNYINIIDNAGHKLLSLINELLNLSEIETKTNIINKTYFNIENLIGSIKKIMEPLLKKKNLKFRYKIKSDVPKKIYTDHNRLQQILLNLIDNAIKFTDKGFVSIIVKKCSKSDARISFCVTDTGIGISAEKKALIFEKFVQGDGSYTRKYGGVGLGLYIVTTLIKKLGGKIKVKSVENKGTTFMFCIKAQNIAKQENETFNNNDEQTEIVINKTRPEKKIVLIEDDINTIKLLSVYFKKNNLKLFVADDSNDGIKKIFDLKPDLAFIDIQLPVINGIEILKKIKLSENHNKIPLIALTAFAMKGDMESLIEKGFDDYVSKPIDFNLLNIKLNTYLFNDK